MSTQVAQKMDLSSLEPLIMDGDLSRLSPVQKLQYYQYRCETVGLDPMSQPFSWMKLQGKLVLYLNRGGSEQLRRKHNVSIVVTDKKLENGVFTVYVQASTGDGRKEDDCGAVDVGNAKGEVLANLQMKAMTKAKRRATIAICSLGMLDEMEVETIPHSKVEPPEVTRAPIDMREMVAGPGLKEEPCRHCGGFPTTGLGHALGCPLKTRTGALADIKSVQEAKAKVHEVEAEIQANKVSGDTVIPFGSLKGKKLSSYTSDEWRTYVYKTQEALQNPEMPENVREQAIEVLELVESYLHG